jgi:hypothetical protein
MQWEKIVTENMVLVDGEETSYRVKDGKRAAVLDLFGSGEFNVPPDLSESRCDMASFGGPHEITLHLSNSDFLIVDKYPGDMAPKLRHYIPWEKIIDIPFVEPSSYYSTRTCQ